MQTDKPLQTHHQTFAASFPALRCGGTAPHSVVGRDGSSGLLAASRRGSPPGGETGTLHWIRRSSKEIHCPEETFLEKRWALFLWAILPFSVKMKEQIFTFIPLTEPSEILKAKEWSPTVFDCILSQTFNLELSFFSLGLLLVAQIPSGFSGGTPSMNCFYLAVAIVDVWLVDPENFNNVSAHVFQN